MTNEQKHEICHKYVQLAACWRNGYDMGTYYHYLNLRDKYAFRAFGDYMVGEGPYPRIYK